MIYWIIGLIVFNLYLLWKVINLNNSILKIMGWGQQVDQSLLKFARSLTEEQTERYIESSCDVCGDILPRNTTRNHNGKKLCGKCKLASLSPVN